jgi:putative ABC transport system permease protein
LPSHNQLAMIRNYFIVTLRNLRNNKLFSTINIAGLAIGLSACFLIWQYVRFESSYDTFHENAHRIYRVPLEFIQNSTSARGIASNYAAVGHAMKTEFPEVKDYCRLVKTSLFTSDLGSYYANALEFSRQDSAGKFVAFNEPNVWFSDAPLLTMFTFPMIAGKEDALTEPNAVVITETIARKYFGDGIALGQEMRLNREMVLKVTGVVRDVPVNSHLQFDILISFSTMRSRLGDMFDNWGWSAFYTYILLEDGADAHALQSKLPAFKVKHIGPQDKGSFQTRFWLQPVTDIHLKSRLESEQSPAGNERTVYFLSILAVFILAVAWINYINLSTARALERSREVGLRKTVGATRSQLIIQFLFDTALINVFALTLAVGIVMVAWAPFETLIGKQIQNILYTGGITPWVIAGLIFLSGVILSGVYPALTLSSFNPAKVLKGKFFKSASGTRLRKLMISFQYVLAVLLMAGTITIYLQLSHMRSMDPGFTKEQVVVIEAPAVYDSSAGGKISFFKNGVLQLPGVRNVTATSDVPGRNIVEGSAVGSINADENHEFFRSDIPSIDTSFFSTFDIRILGGRLFEDQERMAFRRRDKDESIPVLVNEEFVKRLNLENREDALDQKVTFWWGPDQRFAKIIGVVANHHQLSFKERIDPIMYMQPGWHASKYFAVRLDGDFKSVISHMESLYASAFPGHPFSYFFLNEYFDSQYREDQQFGKIFNVFTFLAIVVTCLGLLGLSVFSVAQRTKEVGIRKVLGASGSGILFLFSKDFLRVLLISYAIAVPVIYWAGENWLRNFNFRISLRWQIFALPPLLLLAITLLTITVVGLRAAIETPVRALRQE